MSQNVEPGFRWTVGRLTKMNPCRSQYDEDGYGYDNEISKIVPRTTTLNHYLKPYPDGIKLKPIL